MTKLDHIKYWKDEALENWKTAEYLVTGGQHVMALFLFHLVVEKLLKAHWVKDNVDNYPPRTHDLQNLHNQSNLNLPAEQYDQLAIMNQWNIDTRYPDYKKKIYSIANSKYVEQHRDKVQTLKECLLKNL